MKRFKARLLWSSAVVAGLVSLGCTGTVGGRPTADGGGPPHGTGGAGAGTVSGSGGTGGGAIVGTGGAGATGGTGVVACGAA